MIEPLVQLGQWMHATPYSWILFMPLAVGAISPRYGFAVLFLWFGFAWGFA